jgi:hypothetical protein
MVTETERKIDAALSALMHACGFKSESDTERLFWILFEAVMNVADQWDDTVERSHKEGLSYNVNALLSNEIAARLAAHRGKTLVQ